MRLSFDRLWVVIALVLPALLSLLVPMPAVDLAYQLRAGDELLATGVLPEADSWTYTIAGTPWVDQQWLVQVVLALGYRVGGWELLAVARAGLVVMAFGLLLAACIERGASTRTAAVLSLVAFLLSAPALALRPQLFGIVIFAALLWLVAVRTRRPRAYWLAPLLVMAWANVHGSFVLAPLVLAYAWVDDIAAGRPARTSLVVLVVGSLATLVNPFGTGVWAYAFDLGLNPVIRETVSEWQRTSPLTVPGALFYASVVACVALCAWRWRRDRDSVRWTDVAWLAGWAAIGFSAERGLAWWPLAAAFGVAAWLMPIPAPAGGHVQPPRLAPRPNSLNAVVALVLGTLIVIALPWWRPPDPLTGRDGLLSYAPSGLAQALRTIVKPGDRMFTQQIWASWFEWSSPQALSFLDSRFELFPAEVFAAYGTIARGDAASLAELEQRGTRVVIADPEGALGTRLAGAGWTVAAQVDEGAILVAP